MPSEHISQVKSSWLAQPANLHDPSEKEKYASRKGELGVYTMHTIPLCNKCKCLLLSADVLTSGICTNPLYIWRINDGSNTKKLRSFVSHAWHRRNHFMAERTIFPISNSTRKKKKNTKFNSQRNERLAGCSVTICIFKCILKSMHNLTKKIW